MPENDVTYERTTGSFEGRVLNGLIITIPPSYACELQRHDGEEMYLVLEGTIFCEVDGERYGLNVGGTFTDSVGIELDGGKRRVITAKADSTPPNFEKGVLEAIRKSGLSEGDITSLSHGSTVIINALTERNGAQVGLITTAGFRDVLEIARGDRPNFFDMFYKEPAPFVPRHLSRELTERVNYKGNVVTPFSLDGLDKSWPTSGKRASRRLRSVSCIPMLTRITRPRLRRKSVLARQTSSYPTPMRFHLNGANMSGPARLSCRHI